jgi:hypothetical protein
VTSAVDHAKPWQPILASALLLFIVFVQTPTAFYLHNVQEYLFRWADFFGYLLACWGCLLLVVVVTCRVWRRAASVTFWGSSVLAWCVWIQANVLQWDYGILGEGKVLTHWHYGIVDILAWLAVPAVLWRLRRGLVHKLNMGLAAVVVTATLVTSFNAYQVKPIRYFVDEYPKFDFSPDKNVILLLLDETQSNIFEEIVLSDPRMRSRLSGFTFFREAISNTRLTALSVMMMLTGRFYDNAIPHDNFRELYRTDSIPRDFREFGYETDLFPYRRMEYFHPSFASNIQSKKLRSTSSALKLLDGSLFMSVPHFFKRYVYNGSDWLLGGNREFSETLDGWLHEPQPDGRPPLLDIRIHKGRGDADTLFALDLEANGRTDSERPRFKFYHLRGSHNPFNLDENGRRIPHDLNNYPKIMRYKKAILLRILRKFRELGIYDNSLIVILSDHGSGMTEATRTYQSTVMDKNVARASALLMVKDFGAREFSVTDKPFELMGLRDLLQKLVHGESIENFVEALPDTAVRRFVHYAWKDLHPFVENYTEYIVVGPIWEPGSLIKYHRHQPRHEHGSCVFDRVTSLDYLGEYRLTPKPGRSDQFALTVRGVKNGLYLFAQLRGVPTNGARGTFEIAVSGAAPRKIGIEPSMFLELDYPSVSGDVQIEITQLPDGGSEPGELLNLFESLIAFDASFQRDR